MSIYVVNRPIQLVNGHQSKWSPAHQPISFDVQRRDSYIKNAYPISTPGLGIVTLRIVCDWDLDFLKVKVGDKIQIFSPKSVTLTITSILSKTTFDVQRMVNGVNVNIDINKPFIFLNANFYIEMRVFNVNESLSYTEIGVIRSKTNIEGNAKMSVQELLATKTINQNNFQYNSLNKSQLGEGSRFNIQIREVYNNTPGKYQLLSNLNVLYYTNSANQIQDDYGYNMGSFVPTYDATRTDKAKFQSVFKRPTYFVGYPFSLNFIYSDNMKNYQVYKMEETKDLNGNVITTIAQNLNIAHREAGNRLMLDQNYTSNVKYVDIYLGCEGVEIIKDDYFTEEYVVNYVVIPSSNNNYSIPMYE